MAALKAIPRTAVASFSPTHNYIASGTVSGSLDSSFSSSTFLEVYKLDFSTDAAELPLVASCTTSESVCRLTWSVASDAYRSGLLAGSLADGSINIWDPSLLISEQENGVPSVPLRIIDAAQHKVLGLDFNPITLNVLACGDESGAVYTLDTTDAKNPKELQRNNADGAISNLSWNRKVKNIFATTSYAGTCVVWDTNKQKHILSFSDPSGRKRYSSLQWSPELTTKLVVAIEDDSAPYLQVWDLRNASQPAKQLSGHTKGILSLAWCPGDSSILVSCGKDNRTLCWDVSSEQVIGELPSSSSWNFDVQWSPRLPGILSTSSYDGKVGLYNIETCYATNPSVMSKAPKWLKTPVGANFGFGGKLAVFAAKPVPGKENVSTSEVQVHTLPMDEDVAKCSEEFEAATSGDAKSHMKLFCDRKASEAQSEKEREVWEFLRIMFQEDGGRKALLNQLGFQFTEKEAAVADDLSDTVADVSISQHTDESAFKVIDDGEDFFENLEESKVEEAKAGEESKANGKHEEEEPVIEDPVIEQQVIDETDETIEQALVVGNFKAAVEHCLSVNRVADALVIAYAGGAALWEKTRNQYLKRNTRAYLQVVAAIGTHDLTGLIENRPLTAWKETLALLGTYCSGEEWSPFVNTLASRLDGSGNLQGATLCYIAAGNVEKTVELLSRSLQVEHRGKQAAGSTLQDLVDKSIVLAIATDKRQSDSALASVVERYVEFLANQGCLDSATVYLSLVPGQLSDSLAVLRDRIYRSGQAAEPVKPTVSAMQEPRYMQPTPQVPFPASSQQLYSSNSQYTPVANPPVVQNQFPRPSHFTPQFTPPVPPPHSQFSSGSHQFTTPAAQFTPAPPPQFPSTQFTPAPPPQQASQFTPAPPPPQASQFTPAPAPQYPSTPASQFTPAPPPQFSSTPASQFTPALPPQYSSGPAAQFPAGRPQFTPVTAPQFPPAAPTQPTTMPPVRSFQPSNVSGLVVPRPAQQPMLQPHAPFNPVALQPPAQQQFSSSPFPASQPPAQPLISHLTAEPPAPPAPQPTAQNVDTSNVKDELQPAVAAFRRLFTETSDTSAPGKKREVEDNSRKLGALFVKLNAGDVSPGVTGNLTQLGQCLDGRNYAAALEIVTRLTGESWDECGFWLTPLRRMIKSRQALG